MQRLMSDKEFLVARIKELSANLNKKYIDECYNIYYDKIG